MAENNPNPENSEAAAEPGDSEGLDAAAEAFASINQPQEAQSDPEPDPEPEESDAEEAEEADPEAEPESDTSVEVEYEGKTYKVAPELEKALLRQADYSRKMNEASAKEKAYTSRLELIDGLEKVAEKRAETIAVIKTLDEQIKAYEGIDWARAKSENPAQAAIVAVELMELRQQRQAAEMASKQADGEFREQQQKLAQEQYADMAKVLDKELPGWRGEAGVKLTEYAQKQGIPAEKLAQIRDPQLIVALEKARKFDELQAAKPAIKAKAASAAPVTKPGAPRKPDAKSDAMAKLRKTGSIDAATEAFLATGR